MTIKKLTATVLWTVWSAGILPANPVSGASAPSEADRALADTICRAMTTVHVSRRVPDDEISRRALDTLIDMCDPSHSVFRKEDLDEFEKDADRLDDMFRAGDFSFAVRLHAKYRERLAEGGSQDALEAEMRRTEGQMKEDFVIAIVTAYDAHTLYLPPKTFGLVEARLNLSLCGVGAEWEFRDGALVVARILPGGPLEKNGRVRAGDRIVAVSSKGDGVFKCVAGLNDLDLAALFAGEEGETISIEVERPDGAAETVTVRRERIEMDDLAASSRVVETDAGRLGCLRFGSFYSSAARSCADDVQRELKRLAADDVKGVLLDLRGNPGGSLEDAVKIIGFFVRSGLAVRMKNAGGEVALNVLGRGIECDRPVVVLVDGGSASASEIVAATLQDTGRAIVAGERTAGKGTSQTILALERPPGASLVVTEGRFYRITGASTQLRGVEPDVDVPCSVAPPEREADLRYPFKWNEIDPMPFEPSWDLGRFKAELVARSAGRTVLAATPDAASASLPSDPSPREADPSLAEALNILADLVRLNANRPLPESLDCNNLTSPYLLDTFDDE